MTLRTFVAGLALGFATLALPAVAQDIKGKTINMVVAAPAGAAPDVIARIVADAMRSTLGATIVIENKPGAGGIVAVNSVKGAVADGTRLLFAQGSALVVTPRTYKAAQFDVDRDFDAVAAVGETPMLLTTGSRKGPASLAAAVAAAKLKPDTLAIGNLGVNSFPHLAGEMINQRSGAQFRQIPLDTVGQAVQTVDSGDIEIFIDGAATALPMVAAGRLRGLAVTAARELPGLEGIPLAKDVVPGLVVTGWFVLLAPKGTPAVLVNQLNTALNAAVHNPEVIAKMRALGTYPMGGTVAEAQAFVQAENAKWAEVILKAGIKPQ